MAVKDRSSREIDPKVAEAKAAYARILCGKIEASYRAGTLKPVVTHVKPVRMELRVKGDAHVRVYGSGEVKVVAVKPTGNGIKLATAKKRP